MIAVTSSKQWIHFLRSDRWPPTSKSLQHRGGPSPPTPPQLPGNFSILGILWPYGPWEAPNAKHWVFHCWLGLLLQSLQMRRPRRSSDRRGCGDLWESLSSVLGPKGSVEVETTHSWLLYALNTVCVWLSVFVPSSLYWMASWGSMYCVNYMWLTHFIEKIWPNIFTLMRLDQIWGQSCIIHSNKEVFFGVRRSCHELLSYRQWLSRQDCQTFHIVYPPKCCVFYSGSCPCNLTTSPLGTMGKPLINSSENLLYNIWLTWSGGFWMWNGFLRCQLFWPWFGGYPAQWAGSLQLQFGLSCLGS